MMLSFAQSEAHSLILPLLLQYELGGLEDFKFGFIRRLGNFQNNLGDP